MKLYVSIFALIIFFIPNSYADYNFFPKFKEISLSEYFPENPTPIDNLHSLEKYNRELYKYNKIVLTEYRNRLSKHIENLLSLRSNINKDYYFEKISNEKYTKISERIIKDYKKHSSQGYFANSYLLYYKRYEKRKKWVEESITRLTEYKNRL